MWALLFYISLGFGTGATGGPATIDNFDTKQQCEAFAAKLKQDLKSKFDWYQCYQKK